jgi:hypothetical protein
MRIDRITPAASLRRTVLVFLNVATLAGLAACQSRPDAGPDTEPLPEPIGIHLDPAEVARLAELAGARVPVTLADGLELRLWAPEPLLIDPIALSVAANGDVYVTGSNRSGITVDIRWHPNWTTDALSLRTVEDLRAFFRRELAPERSVENADWLPDLNEDVQGRLDWDRRHQLMRTHTALHVLCGVIWADFGVAVTGGNMEPGTGRLDFELDAMSAELGQRVERRINEEIQRARDVLVDFVDRGEADRDPALIRTKANLIPASINPLRVIDIVGLDKQADGGTHVASTAEVGRVEVTKTESKGKANKRIRIAVH